MRKITFVRFMILITLFSLSVDSGFCGPRKRRKEKKTRKQAQKVVDVARTKMKMGDKGFSKRDRTAIEEAEVVLGTGFLRRKKKKTPSIMEDVEKYNKYIGVREKFKKEAEKKRLIKKGYDQYLKAKDMPGLSDDTKWTEKRMEGIGEELKVLEESAKWFGKPGREIKRTPFKETEEGKRVLLRGKALDKEIGDSIKKEMLASGKLSKMFSDKERMGDLVAAKDADFFEGEEYKNLRSAHESSSDELKKMTLAKDAGLFEYDESAKLWAKGLTAEEARKELESVSEFGEEKEEGIKKLLNKQLEKREKRDLEIKNIKESDKIARELKLLNAKPVKTFNDWEDIRNLRKRFSEGWEKSGISEEPPSIKDLGEVPALKELGDLKKDAEEIQVKSKNIGEEITERDRLKGERDGLYGKLLGDLKNEDLRSEYNKKEEEFQSSDAKVKRLEKESTKAVETAAEKAVEVDTEKRALSRKDARKLLRGSGAENQMLAYAKAGDETQKMEKELEDGVKRLKEGEVEYEAIEKAKTALDKESDEYTKKDEKSVELKEEVNVLRRQRDELEQRVHTAAADMEAAKTNVERILKEEARASDEDIENVFKNAFAIKPEAKERRVANFVAGHKKMLAAGTLGASLAALAGAGFVGTVGAGAAGTGLAAGTIVIAAGAAGEGEGEAGAEVYEPEPYTFDDYDFASYEYGAEEFTGI